MANQPSIEELEKQLEEKEKALAGEQAAREEAEAKVAAFEEGKKTGKVTVPGEIVLKGKDPDGNSIDGKYRVRPGHPNLRVPVKVEEIGNNKALTEAVTSEAVVKVANGKKLNKEEQEANPALKGWDAAAAKKYFGVLAIKRSYLLEKIGMIALLLIMLVGFQPQADAQIRTGEIFDFTLDTMTNADTLVLDPNEALGARDDYDYVWQFNAVNLTGTSTGTCLIKESLLGTGFFITRDTFTISGSSAGFETGITVGRYQKCECITSGTGTTQLKVIAAFRRKERK
jgi:hypothetical protein